ncbi:MAG: sigma-70 family RNA polymerase sigma factor [Pseudomonadota bacterium]
MSSIKTIISTEPFHQDQIYRANHPWLVSLFKRLLSNNVEAEDLAHDAFLRLFKREESFDSYVAARPFLHRVAKGIVIDKWRKRNIEKAYLEALANLPEQLHPSAEQENAVLQVLQLTSKVLSALPPKTANAFNLAVVQGYKDKEVAEIMGISSRMVRKHVARVMLSCAKLKISPH